MSTLPRVYKEPGGENDGEEEKNKNPPRKPDLEVQNGSVYRVLNRISLRTELQKMLLIEIKFNQ